MDNRICTLSYLKKDLDYKRREGAKVVFTNGCFDLLHVGHIRYLKEAKSKGDILVVALNSDSSVRSLKGEKRPLLPEEERAELLVSLEMVDYVTIFSQKTAKDLIALLKPDVYVKGGDYRVDDLPEAQIVKGYGGKVELLLEVKGASTTNIIDRVLKSYRS